MILAVVVAVVVAAVVGVTFVNAPNSNLFRTHAPKAIGGYISHAAVLL